MKKIKILTGMVILAGSLWSCEGKLFGITFNEFGLQFPGEYVGVFYKPKGGNVVYFDSTNAPILLIGGGARQVKVTVGDRIEEHLTDIWGDKKRSDVKRKNGTYIIYGQDRDGNRKSLRVYNPNNSREAEYQQIASNFILGDYDRSKDTVDIYYKYIDSGISTSN